MWKKDFVVDSSDLAVNVFTSFRNIDFWITLKWGKRGNVRVRVSLTNPQTKQKKRRRWRIKQMKCENLYTLLRLQYIWLRKKEQNHRKMIQQKNKINFPLPYSWSNIYLKIKYKVKCVVLLLQNFTMKLIYIFQWCIRTEQVIIIYMIIYAIADSC